jgi:hypothetical protein
MFIVTRQYLDEDHRSKLCKRDAPSGLFFFILTSEKNTVEGENKSLQKSSSWRRESKGKHKFVEICSRFSDLPVSLFFFMLKSEQTRMIQHIKGGNISLQKSST